MEVKNGIKFPLSVFLAELVGTMIFGVAVNMDCGSHILGIAYAVAVFMVWEISGGHLNPAVSVGVFISTRKYYNNVIFMFFIMVA